MAVVLSKVVVLVPPVGTKWVGSYLLLGFGALIIAGGMGLDGFSGDIKVRSFSWLQPGTVLAGIAVCLVSAGGAVWWAWCGTPPYLERNRLYAISAVRHECHDVGCAPQGACHRPFDGSARYSVMADDHVRSGDADRGFTFGGSLLSRPTS